MMMRLLITRYIQNTDESANYSNLHCLWELKLQKSKPRKSTLTRQAEHGLMKAKIYKEAIAEAQRKQEEKIAEIDRPVEIDDDI